MAKTLNPIMIYRNLLPLPDHLVELVYLYDPTYKEVFNVVLHEMNIWHQQREELIELLVSQELERNMFEMSARAYLGSL